MPIRKDGSGLLVNGFSQVRKGDGTVLFSKSLLPNGLTNRWRIDEGSGSALSDSEGSQPATANGATWVSDSKYTGGEAISHDGTDDWTVSDNSFGINNSQFSVAFWVNFDSFPDYGRVISASSVQNTSRNVANGYRVGLELGKEFAYTWRDSGKNTARVESGVSLSTGVDYFMAINGDADAGEFYIYDSTSQLANVSFTGGSHDTGVDKYLRFMAGDNIYTGGVIDDVIISTTTAWTQSEVETIWQDTLR